MRFKTLATATAVFGVLAAWAAVGTPVVAPTLAEGLPTPTPTSESNSSSSAPVSMMPKNRAQIRELLRHPQKIIEGCAHLPQTRAEAAEECTPGAFILYPQSGKPKKASDLGRLTLEIIYAKEGDVTNRDAEVKLADGTIAHRATGIHTEMGTFDSLYFTAHGFRNAWDQGSTLPNQAKK